MSTQPDTMREAFEVFAVQRGFSIGRDIFLSGAPYMSVWVAGAWESWQAATALATAAQWMPIETAPKKTTILVYSPPQSGDWPDTVRIDFDFICPDYEDWYNHSESREHYLAVGGPNAAGPDTVCTGPSEKAPYTHWMPLPPPPAIRAGEALEGET